MTKIRFYHNNQGEILGFQTIGHAGYAEYGEDIVCAGVSALVLNTVNSIETLTADRLITETDEVKGIIRTKFSGRRSREGQLLMQSLRLGVLELEAEYDQFIQVSFKEV